MFFLQLLQAQKLRRGWARLELAGSMLSKPLCRDGKLDVGSHMRKVLAARGWTLAVAPPMEPLTVQSHCSGADAPCFALMALGIPHTLQAASECEPNMALYHLTYHKAEHLFHNIACMPAGGGPCLKHGRLVCPSPRRSLEVAMLKHGLQAAVASKPKAPQNRPM